jgi:hypothetical protein
MDEFILDYPTCRARLAERLAEPAPGRIQLLTGPRQVGKTTLLLELARQHGETAIYAACDGPEASLPGFWERLWAQARGLAEERRGAALLLDEIQHVSQWATRLKGEWDRLRRRKTPLHVVATGSSALRLGAGSRESLAGRFERLVLSHWSARALSDAFSLDAAAAAEVVVRLGSYPGAMALRSDPVRWRAYIRDAIIEPAVGKDILTLAVVRRPALLRQVFALAVSMPARIVSIQKLQGQLQDPGTLETIAHYLKLLEEAYLVAPLEKYAPHPLHRSAPPKLVILNNALVAAMDPAPLPDPAVDPARYGAWVENACLAYAWNAGQRVTYWRAEPLEVDGVVEGSWGAWALEVKTGPYQPGELRGLLEFCRKYPRFRPLVLTDTVGQRAARAAGVPALAWAEFLIGGPATAR